MACAFVSTGKFLRGMETVIIGCSSPDPGREEIKLILMTRDADLLASFIVSQATYGVGADAVAGCPPLQPSDAFLKNLHMPFAVAGLRLDMAWRSGQGSNREGEFSTSSRLLRRTGRAAAGDAARRRLQGVAYNVKAADTDMLITCRA